MFMLVLLACIFVHDDVVAMTNITVDDMASSIVYSGSWGISAPSKLDYGGSHHLSTDESAIATFTFTGVAVYYMSPKWPYPVNTELSVDGGPGQVVDLQDYSRPATSGGPETVGYSVVWRMTGLANSQHQLVASMAPGGLFVEADGFIYTVLDPTDISSSSSSLSTSSSSTSSASSTSHVSSPSSTSANDTSSHQSHNSKLIAPIVGAAAAAAGLVALVALLLLCCRGRRDRDSSLKGTARGSQSARGSIGPEISFHASQPGVMSPAPSAITPNLAGYGAFPQQMPNERNYPIAHPSPATRPPELYSAYPAGAVDPATTAMRAYASDPFIGSNMPNPLGYNPQALYDRGASPISKLSTALASTSSGASTNAQTFGGYQGGIPADRPTTLFETRSTSSSSYQPSTSGYPGMVYNYGSDQKQYMSDQKLFTSSPQPSVASRIMSPAPAYWL